MSLAKGARMQGAQFFSDIEVDKVLETTGADGLKAVSGVQTTCGIDFACEIFEFLINWNIDPSAIAS